MIKAILLLSAIVIFFWLLSNRATSKASAGVKLVAFGFFVMAIMTIIKPGITNDIAEYVGVGRGADLLIYVLAVLFTFHIVSAYIKSKEEQRKIVALARKIAIIEANGFNKKNIK